MTPYGSKHTTVATHLAITSRAGRESVDDLQTPL
jgi:hypothetical protein